jgi:hypothetical protein
MARMLGGRYPGYRRTCAKKHVRRGCRCFLYPDEHGRRAAVLRRRAGRKREKGSRAGRA